MSFLQRYFRHPRQLAFRQLTFEIHWWAAIILMLYLIVIGVTGSILVFRSELERACGLKPWPHIRVHGQVAEIAAVAGNLRAAYPHRHIVSIMAPSRSNDTFVAVLQTPQQIRLACEPSNGRVLGQFPTASNWLDFIAELHTNLLAHRAGRVGNGLGAAALLLLTSSGLVIWWPGIRAWRRAVKVDFGRSWRRINFDLHSAAGFWTILITSFWAVSGIYFTWPRQVFLLVNALSPVITARPPAIRVTPQLTAPEPDVQALVERARKLDPNTTPAGMFFPFSRTAPLAVLMRRGNGLGFEYVDTVYFNPYSGEYISTWKYGVNQSLGDWIIWSQVPLHFGVYWGLGVKLIWFTAGLSLPLLAGTGLLMYWNRTLRRRWNSFGKQEALI